MPTNRIEAFSDGVLAIIITVMVLELDVPDQPTLHALGHSVVGLVSYLLSFGYVGIYWNNHHHLFQLVEDVDGAVMWANLHLLFWLSLFPFTTAWVDNSRVAGVPAFIYGTNLLLAASAYYLLQLTLVRRGESGARLRAALGRDVKGRLSPVLYIAGMLLTLVEPWLGMATYGVVALMWLVPDRRVEGYLAAARDSASEPRPPDGDATA